MCPERLLRLVSLSRGEELAPEICSSLPVLPLFALPQPVENGTAFWNVAEGVRRHEDRISGSFFLSTD